MTVRDDETTISLTEKERALLWLVACQFNHPITAKLKEKLYFEDAHLIADKHEPAIMDRIISLGGWYQNYRGRQKKK